MSFAFTEDVIQFVQLKKLNQWICKSSCLRTNTDIMTVPGNDEQPIKYISWTADSCVALCSVKFNYQNADYGILFTPTSSVFNYFPSFYSVLLAIILVFVFKFVLWKIQNSYLTMGRENGKWSAFLL